MTFTIPADYLTLGENSVTLTCNYAEDHPGLEIVYLLGDFGVSVDGVSSTIIDAPRTLTLGDWTTQGLPFYGGNVSYRQHLVLECEDNQRLLLQVPEYNATGIRILIDGTEAGIVAWEPNEVDFTSWADGRTVELTLELLGHRRNSHGPLHLSDPAPVWLGPGQFTTTGDQWTDEYQFVSCGLIAPPQFIRRPS